MSQGVYVLGGKCPGGKCPGGKCPGGICPWGKCPGGTCPGGLCPRTVIHGKLLAALGWLFMKWTPYTIPLGGGGYLPQVLVPTVKQTLKAVVVTAEIEEQLPPHTLNFWSSQTSLKGHVLTLWPLKQDMKGFT